MKFRLPVRLDGGQVEPIGALPLPGLRPNGKAYLTFDSDDLARKEQVALYQQKLEVPVPIDDGILVGLRTSLPISGEFKEDIMPWSLQYNRFVQIAPLAPLIIETSAARFGRMLPCEIKIPALDATAGSLNQAYTMLSEAFEPERISHTGNVFETCWFFYVKAWLPLGWLRDRGAL